MKITEVKVETKYTVSITFNDFIEAYEKYQDSSEKGYIKAFEGLTDESEMQDFRWNFENFGHTKATKDVDRFIAKLYGYDKSVFVGLYYKNKDVVVFEFVNNGDTL